MNLRKEILRTHSKAQCDKIVKYISDHQNRFDELVQLFLNDEYRVVQRAAWPLSYAVRAHPFLVKKHMRKIILNLRNPRLHDSVKRNTVRFLQEVDIPSSLHGEVMNVCFRYLEDPKEAVAIKVFSMSVLSNLAKQYPEIKPEIKVLLEDQFPRQTAAFKNRAKKILHQMEKRS